MILNNIGLQLNNNVLVVEQNNYATRIVANRYAQQFYIKKLFFGATNKVKNNYKSEYVHSDHIIVFNGAGS